MKNKLTSICVDCRRATRGIWCRCPVCWVKKSQHRHTDLATVRRILIEMAEDGNRIKRATNMKYLQGAIAPNQAPPAMRDPSEGDSAEGGDASRRSGMWLRIYGGTAMRQYILPLSDEDIETIKGGGQIAKPYHEEDIIRLAYLHDGSLTNDEVENRTRGVVESGDDVMNVPLKHEDLERLHEGGLVLCFPEGDFRVLITTQENYERALHDPASEASPDKTALHTPTTTKK